MASELEQRAKEAFVDDEFELANDLYTQAIGLSPRNAYLFAGRAQVNIKLSNFTDAVADANKAIELDPSMAKAYLRKGTACMKLEEYHTAKVAFEMGASLDKHDQRFTRFIKECDKSIAEESSDLATLIIPNGVSGDGPSTFGPQTSEVDAGAMGGAGARNSFCYETIATEPARPKYRHEYYQKPEEVVVTIFAKGISTGDVVVDFGEQILSVTIDVANENPYHFQPRLFAKIIPNKCRYEILSTKIEIRLAKAEAIHWTSLEFSKDVTAVRKVNVSSGSHRPAYPSSKTRATDWDKLVAEVKREERSEKLDGDAGMNKAFRDIYESADEDTRRAMSKSFLESNGTVLSTNWKDVGSKVVEGSPPDGMELKKWEY